MTSREPSEPNPCDRPALRPDLRDRALRVLPSAMRPHSLRRRLERQRPHREGFAGASPGRRWASPAGAREAGPSGHSPVVGDPGAVGSRRCGRDRTRNERGPAAGERRERADAATIERCAVRPVEYKSGFRHGTAADLQLCAQALCLEEMLGVAVPEGHVWYGGPRRKVRVPFTPALRDEVRSIIREIRMQLLTADLPAAPNDRRCVECQLRHHCLPELTAAPDRVNRYMASVVFRCAT